MVNAWQVSVRGKRNISSSCKTTLPTNPSAASCRLMWVVLPILLSPEYSETNLSSLTWVPHWFSDCKNNFNCKITIGENRPAKKFQQTTESITNIMWEWKSHRFPHVPVWVERDNLGYFFFLEICTQCRRKLEEASSGKAFPTSESAKASESIEEHSDVETEEGICTEDITRTQVYNSYRRGYSFLNIFPEYIMVPGPAENNVFQIYPSWLLILINFCMNRIRALTYQCEAEGEE